MITKTNIKRLFYFRNTGLIQILITVALGAVLIIASPDVFSAQQDKAGSSDKKIEQGPVSRTEPKVVQGELIGFIPKDKPEYIGIAVEKDNTDYYLVLDEVLQVTHKKDLSELVVGDTIRVDYDEIIEPTEDGKEKSKRIAKIVTFIKRASDSGGLISKESDK